MITYLLQLVAMIYLPIVRHMDYTELQLIDKILKQTNSVKVRECLLRYKSIYHTYNNYLVYKEQETRRYKENPILLKELRKAYDKTIAEKKVEYNTRRHELIQALEIHKPSVDGVCSLVLYEKLTK